MSNCQQLAILLALAYLGTLVVPWLFKKWKKVLSTVALLSVALVYLPQA